MSPREPARERSAIADPVPEERVRPHEGRPFLLGTIHPATEEIRELAETLGMRLVAEVYQGRDRPHPGTFFGKGKLEALKEAIGELRAGRVPDGWTWDGHEFRMDGEPGEPDETAWGGTPWVRAHQTGEGNVSRQDKGTGDPPTSVGRGTEERQRVGVDGGEPVGDEGPHAHRTPPPGLSEKEEGSLLLILNEDVRPAVLFNLEERLKVEVWDRTRLILEIFGQHAHVKEAKLQVELAMLQYEIPLIHEAVHRKRTGERPGFMGGGEYEVADYEDFIKRRMRAVKEDLERIRRERSVRRKVRREQFYLMSLAGYTNAGKSSLLNALTGAEVHQKQEMFSTLQTTTRRMVDAAALERLQEDGEEHAGTEPRPATGGPGGGPPAPQEGDDDAGSDNAGSDNAGDDDAVPAGPVNAYTRPILLTDTVGFIQALPSWLLDAFRSTLEEISVSDVVLLVADVADPVEVLLEKVRVCREELAFLDVTCPIILVLNKVDLVPKEAVAAKRLRLIGEGLARDDLVVSVSSVTSERLDRLGEEIHRVLPPMVPYEADIPTDSGGQRFVSRLYEWGEVSSVDYGVKTKVHGLADPLHWKNLVREALSCGADLSRRSR